jgi:DNA-binding GntR family transcriptional regulator
LSTIDNFDPFRLVGYIEKTMKIHSIVDHTAKALEDMIVKGKLKPGQKVKEQEISTRLGISRPPLREAFKILEAEGLIRREPRRGVFVSELKDADIWEIYTLKLALYTLGVTLAMDKITNGEVEKLEKVVAQMEKSVQRESGPDVMKYEELNNLFHEMTANIAGHTRLKKIQQSLNNQIKRIAYRSFGDRKHLEASCKYHRKILEAIKAKDKTRAEQLTREHILRGLEVQEKMSKSAGRME